MSFRAQRRVRRGAASQGSGLTERLEQRTLLSAQWPGAVVGVTPGSTAVGSLPAMTLVDTDGGAAMVRKFSPVYPIGAAARSGFVGPVATAPKGASAAAGAFDIVLIKGPNLQSNAAASAAFDQAAAFFESIFHDPITVHIDAEIAPLGTNILGEAMSVIMGDSFDTIRDRMVADANPADEAFVSQLPASADFQSTLPDSSFSITGALANRANLLALGFPASELDYGNESEYEPGVKIDASITFSSNYPFDYDRSDGIGFNKSDFVGVATHEIGHALGFMSAVDQVDYVMSNGGDGGIGPTPLDMFRFKPGEGAADFAGGTRVMSPGNVVTDQVFYDGGYFNPSGITGISGLTVGDIPFSTGVQNGDTWQASHWKDDQYIGGASHTIGLMDPLAPHAVMQWTAAETRAMGLIGWDTAAVAAPASISGVVYDDANADGRKNANESGMSGWEVYQDLNNNGQWDDGTAVRTATDTPKDIPDPGTATSSIVVSDLPGVVTDLNVVLTIIHPWTPDVTATLISPRGTRVLLFSDQGSIFAHEDFDGTTLDDEAGARIQDETPPFTASYQPMGNLSDVDGQPMNGTWRLQVSDVSDQDEGYIDNWSLVFTTGDPEPYTATDGDGNYEFTGLAAGTYRIREIQHGGWTQTEPGANGAHVITLVESQQATGRNFGNTFGVATPSVVARHVFYNHSVLDGNGGNADASDDAAIAADKQALLPGAGPATSANYTSYSRGVNGIMIDVSSLASDTLSPSSDFTFRAGNSDDPSAWDAVAVEPSQITVRRGAGENGSDRITVVWPDGAIRNQWLQVSLLATGNTGLGAADTFYFGNLAGDTGGDGAAATVNGFDLLALRRSMAARSAGVNADHDFNRDGKVNALDLAVVRASQGKSLTLFSAPAAAAAGFGEVPIAAAATALRPNRAWDESTAPLLA